MLTKSIMFSPDDIISGVQDDTIPGDEAITTKKDPRDSDVRPKEKPPKYTLRESIDKALEESNKSRDTKTDGAKDTTTRDATTKKPTDKLPLVKVEKKNTQNDPAVDIADKKADTKTSTSTDQTVDAAKPPVGWSKDAKSEWDGLSENVKASIFKREKEASDGFKEYGEKTKSLKTFEDVIDKYVPGWQGENMTRHGVVERALQWVQALNGPNKAEVAKNVKTLAERLQITNEVAELFKSNTSSTTTTAPKSNTLSSQDNSEIKALKDEVEGFKRTFSEQQTQRGINTIRDWAQDKPHFEKVRDSMRRLMESNIVELPKDQLPTAKELDKAYDMAVRMDPELYSQRLEEDKARLEEEAEQTRLKDRRESQISNAKTASSSVKSGPPLTNTTKSSSNPRKMSVRQAIDRAFDEHR